MQQHYNETLAMIRSDIKAIQPKIHKLRKVLDRLFPNSLDSGLRGVSCREV